MPTSGSGAHTLWLNWHERDWFEFTIFQSAGRMAEALGHDGPWPLRVTMADLDRLDAEGRAGRIVGSHSEAAYHGRCDVLPTMEDALAAVAEALPFLGECDVDPLCGRDAASLIDAPVTVCMDLVVVSAVDVCGDPAVLSEEALADAIDLASPERDRAAFYTSPVLLVHEDGRIECGGAEIVSNPAERPRPACAGLLPSVSSRPGA